MVAGFAISACRRWACPARLTAMGSKVLLFEPEAPQWPPIPLSNLERVSCNGEDRWSLEQTLLKP